MSSKLDDAFKRFVQGKISKISYENEVEKDKLNSAIGKRVRIVKQYDMMGRPGLVGKIVGLSAKGNLAIHFDEHMNGHTCGNRVPKGYGYNVSIENVEFID